MREEKEAFKGDVLSFLTDSLPKKNENVSMPYSCIGKKALVIHFVCFN